jgi:hypothetical protein
MKNKIPDIFIPGFICSVLLSLLFFLFFEYAVFPFAAEESVQKFFSFPLPYFYLIALEIIFMRILFINWHKQEFAKGWMTGVFIFAFFIFYRIKLLNHV